MTTIWLSEVWISAPSPDVTSYKQAYCRDCGFGNQYHYTHTIQSSYYPIATMPGARFAANPIIILGNERARIGRHEIPCRMAIDDVVEAITIIRPDGPTEYKFSRNVLFNPGESVELDPSGE
ncbi:unnamed protein product [Aspergillus oryzae var. brunneus]|uniref:Unnamed protein product n=1 Tax=Aspergillus oryzae var. brunneus TaxID=332754 RepID=A0ABQ6KHU8_ASPOZ|nr:unnamed protein product [Aspergillus oryzae]GMG41752.1 unnamed protein product [Aspergillus oryzae var. brunneus]